MNDAQFIIHAYFKTTQEREREVQVSKWNIISNTRHREKNIYSLCIIKNFNLFFYVIIYNSAFFYFASFESICKLLDINNSINIEYFKILLVDRQDVKKNRVCHVFERRQVCSCLISCLDQPLSMMKSNSGCRTLDISVTPLSNSKCIVMNDYWQHPIEMQYNACLLLIEPFANI